jgi:deoxyribodipyrimidine photo-lyase
VLFRSFQTNEALIESWIQGHTGYPLVDAAMRELLATGYMSNRARQNVASFFVHYLKQDWRIGADYFASTLLDYDPSSNYLNWQYVAGVGNDPRDHRIFNVHKQGRDYDPQAAYVYHWVPELVNIPVALLYPKSPLTASERQSLRACGYPDPIVRMPF